MWHIVLYEYRLQLKVSWLWPVPFKKFLIQDLRIILWIYLYTILNFEETINFITYCSLKTLLYLPSLSYKSHWLNISMKKTTTCPVILCMLTFINLNIIVWLFFTSLANVLNIVSFLLVYICNTSSGDFFFCWSIHFFLLLIVLKSLFFLMLFCNIFFFILSFQCFQFLSFFFYLSSTFSEFSSYHHSINL